MFRRLKNDELAGVWGVTPKEIEIKKLFPETKEGARSYFVLGIMEQFVAGIFFVFAFIFWFLVVGKTHTFLTCSAEFINILDLCADRSMYIMDIIMRLRNFRYAGEVPKYGTKNGICRHEVTFLRADFSMHGHGTSCMYWALKNKYINS